MSNIVLLKGWNNYFNRKYKAIERTQTISDFNTFVSTYNGITLSASNFNQNDGVDTFHIFNSTIDASGTITKDIKEYSYLILIEVGAANVQITSCWFVTKLEKTRGGQYKATLKRDLICDYYDNIKDSPVFVEKAILNNDDPMIFNNEGMNFNQIKQSEYLLKKTKTRPWIVAYFEKGSESASPSPFTTYTSASTSTNYPNISVLKMNDNHESFALSGNIKVLGAVRVTGQNIPGTVEFSSNTKNMTDFIATDFVFAYHPVSFSYFTKIDLGDFNQRRNELCSEWTEAIKVYKNSLKSHFEAYNSTADEELFYDESTLLQYDGKTVFDSVANKYYIVHLTEGVDSNQEIVIRESGTTNQIYPDMVNIASVFCSEIGKTFNIESYGGGIPRATFRMYVTRKKYIVSLEETEPTGVIHTDLSTAIANYNQTVDCSYNIMACEYDENTLNLMYAIQKGFGSKMIDVQVVPYCPFREFFDYEYTWQENYDCVFIKDSSNLQYKIPYLLFAKSCRDSFSIPYTYICEDNKIESQTDFIRLVSPNYNGVYQFVPTKNNGINGFTVDVTFKPISPYIHVAPTFNGLYGYSFNDDRGLICNGDFSVDMTSNSWREYEIANKNYQNIFEAQISTMDANNRLDITNQLVNGQMGAVAAGVGVGMSTGSWAAGGVMSAASGIANFVDVGMGQAYYKNNKELTLDKYNYDLGNIKARGQSTKKISSLTNNNKYFPFIEFYTCTDEEKQALRNKIKFNGMTVMRIGKISEFEGRDYDGLNYFQGQLIRCESLDNDTYLIQQIDYELKKGVYL